MLFFTDAYFTYTGILALAPKALLEALRDVERLFEFSSFEPDVLSALDLLQKAIRKVFCERVAGVGGGGTVWWRACCWLTISRISVLCSAYAYTNLNCYTGQKVEGA